MAAPTKKRELQPRNENIDNNEEEHSSSDDPSDCENEDASEAEQGMEIQVDFEGRNPQDPDFNGIKILLQQLFLKAHLDLGGLTNLIITQNYVGSVVKQSSNDAEDSDEDDDPNNVFGITTVVNISEKQDQPCVKQLRDLLKQLAEEHATDATNALIRNVLENDAAPLGLLINERFINIPAQISVPLLENLVSEIDRAAKKKMPFKFSYFILICKVYEIPNAKKDPKTLNKSNAPQVDVLWSNPEEEIFAEEADCSFEFSVENDSDSELAGTWTESDNEMKPYRKVLLFESSKLQSIIDKIKLNVAGANN
ncbi:protein BCCIP homolog isoform X2 [Diprion similis]|uniref:protein BCCIP homolog isoform X2 n=1 Tax=Diprion similis TaxID=362088 RepID=UPI001EF7868B|nr:protein BCCIP homolog isoform X2 [Diprion similis]